jgi:hypothetical protein
MLQSAPAEPSIHSEAWGWHGRARTRMRRRSGHPAAAARIEERRRRSARPLVGAVAIPKRIEPLMPSVRFAAAHSHVRHPGQARSRPRQVDVIGAVAVVVEKPQLNSASQSRERSPARYHHARLDATLPRLCKGRACHRPAPAAVTETWTRSGHLARSRCRPLVARSSCRPFW